MSTPEQATPQNAPKSELIGATKSPLLTPSPVQRELLESEKVTPVRTRTDIEEEPSAQKLL